MADTWLNIIKGKKKDQLEKLKADLKGRTIVGEYCGNPEYQHLVKYADITIYFYALVENDSKFSCLPPNAAFEFLGKHGIPIVKNHEKSYFGHFTSFPEFGAALSKLFE